MTEIVTLLDEALGLPGEHRRQMVRRLEIVASTTTVRELIAERVRRDFAENALKPRNGSSGPSSRMRWEGIFHLDDSTVPRVVTEDDAVEQALAAVHRGEVLIFWNDRHIEDLDFKLDLMGENEVVFMRLFPIKGG